MVLLANPVAGKRGTAHVVSFLVDRLRAAGRRVRVVSNDDPDLALTELHTAVACGARGIVAVGGDGTVNLALQAVAGTDVPLGIVAAGTGNDAARALGLPLKDVGSALDVVLADQTRLIDAARAGDHWFLTVMAAGFDAVVNERANRMSWPPGQMRYNLATLIELSTFRPLPYTIDLDGRSITLDAMLVAVGNGPSFGGGLRITEGALIDDGLLDVVVIRPVSKLELVRTYPKLFRGTHVTHPQYERHRARRVTVAAPGVVAYADGERLAPLPITVECIPSAVKVYA
jgi:diacylglycerol kinase (ATP)